MHAVDAFFDTLQQNDSIFSFWLPLSSSVYLDKAIFLV